MKWKWIGGCWWPVEPRDSLGPCHFCESLDVDVFCVDDGGNCPAPNAKLKWAVECNNCAAGGPWSGSKKAAIIRWNKRIL